MHCICFTDHPFSLSNKLREEDVDSKSPANMKMTLRVGKLGSLETLHWREEPALPEIPEAYVEIEPQAVGLNFRDILLAMGVMSQDEPGPVVLGFEARQLLRMPQR